MDDQPIPRSAVVGYAVAVVALVVGGVALGAVSKPVRGTRIIPPVVTTRPNGAVPGLGTP